MGDKTDNSVKKMVTPEKRNRPTSAEPSNNESLFNEGNESIRKSTYAGIYSTTYSNNVKIRDTKASAMKKSLLKSNMALRNKIFKPYTGPLFGSVAGVPAENRFLRDATGSSVKKSGTMKDGVNAINNQFRDTKDYIIRPAGGVPVEELFVRNDVPSTKRNKTTPWKESNSKQSSSTDESFTEVNEDETNSIILEQTDIKNQTSNEENVNLDGTTANNRSQIIDNNAFLNVGQIDSINNFDTNSVVGSDGSTLVQSATDSSASSMEPAAGLQYRDLNVKGVSVTKGKKSKCNAGSQTNSSKSNKKIHRPVWHTDTSNTVIQKVLELIHESTEKLTLEDEADVIQHDQADTIQHDQADIQSVHKSDVPKIETTAVKRKPISKKPLHVNEKSSHSAKPVVVKVNEKPDSKGVLDLRKTGSIKTSVLKNRQVKKIVNSSLSSESSSSRKIKTHTTKRRRRKPIISRVAANFDVKSTTTHEPSVLESTSNPANRQRVKRPTKPLADVFFGRYPLGQEMKYEKSKDDRTAKDRATSEEARTRERLHEGVYNDARHAAEAHRQTRKYIQKWVKPGVKLIQLSERTEWKARVLVGANGLKAGLAFPAGCSRNNCAAHYTSNPGDKKILKYNDVTKIDFGTHVNGHIIDCAWTLTFNPKYDKLVEAVREATNAGIQAAGIDVRLSEIGTSIHEVLESYEVELDGKLYGVRPIRNLSGHSIKPYRIHAGKVIPIFKSGPGGHLFMEENEFYAIETLGSTGRGIVVKDLDCSHYMKRYDYDVSNSWFKLSWSHNLLNVIDTNFGNLAFCKRWLEGIGFPKYRISLNELCNAGIILPYPPLCDVPGSYTAQFEHTIVLRPTCKEVISRGPDY